MTSLDKACLRLCTIGLRQFRRVDAVEPDARAVDGDDVAAMDLADRPFNQVGAKRIAAQAA